MTTAEVATPNFSECPFPGPASYDYDLRASFRGRNEEASELAATVLGRRLTVLTSGSGDGKTSLIHAGIVPLLLYDGIEITVAEPGGQAPLAEIGKFCLDRLRINRDSARFLTQQLIRKLGDQKSLRDSRSYCLRLRKEERQKLLTGRDAARPVNLLEGGAFATWLRDPQISDDYLARSATAIASNDCIWPGPDVPLSQILCFFEAVTPFKAIDLSGHPAQAKHYLIDLIGKAIEARRNTDEDFELVMILDQFEEIFTQYRDLPRLGSDQKNRWHHRAETVAFITELVQRRLPIRVVLSIRKEHYADLQAAFGDPEALAASTYHLAPLTERQALECLTQPYAWPGSPPTQSQAMAVVEALSVEQRYVHPTLLSVVGEWLWLHPNRGGLSEDELRSAIPGAIDAFVRRAFDSPKQDGRVWSVLEQHEALDILDQLIIRDGSLARRNSVAESTVLDSPLRDRVLRKRIIDVLEKSRLVRREMRLGGWYVEIVHERLIDALQRLAHDLRRNQPNLADLPVLLDELRAEAREPVTIGRPLPRRLLPVLFANVERIELPPVLAARIFGRLLSEPNLLDIDAQSTAGLDARSGGAARSSTLRSVLKKLGKDASRDTSSFDQNAEKRIAEGQFVSPAEAELLRSSPERLSDVRMLSLIIASSLIHRDAGAAERLRKCGQLLRRGGVQ